MIPRIRFDDLITIDEWAGALQQILTAATAATRSNNSSDRLDLQGLLLTYIKKSPPKVELLDVIARETIDDLALAEISLSLDRIASRNAELHRAASLIGAVASEAKKDARALQLESVFDALTKAQAAVDALKALESSLSDPDQKLLAKLRSVGQTIAELNSMVRPGNAD
jgi:hypothetical protein